MAFSLRLKTGKTVDGCIVVQDKLDIEEFARLVESHVPDGDAWIYKYKRIEPGTRGCAMFDTRDKWVMCIWRDTDPDPYITFVHELVHVVENHFRVNELAMTRENEEFKANMHHNLFQCFRHCYSTDPNRSFNFA